MSNPQYARPSQGGDPSNTTGKQDLRLYLCLCQQGTIRQKEGWGEAGGVWDGAQNREQWEKRNRSLKQRGNKQETAASRQQAKDSSGDTAYNGSNLGNQQISWQKTTAQTAKHRLSATTSGRRQLCDSTTPRRHPALSRISLV